MSETILRTLRDDGLLHSGNEFQGGSAAVCPNPESRIQLLDEPDIIMDLESARNSEYGILSGGTTNDYQIFEATSFSNSTLSITPVSPSPAHVMSKKVYLRVNQRFTLTGTAGVVSPNILAVDSTGTQIVGFDSVRWGNPYPGICSAAFGIDNQQFTFTPSKFVNDTYQRYFADRDDLERGGWSGTGYMPDSAQSYTQTDQSSLDPMGRYGNNGYWTTRNSGKITIVSNTPTQAIVDVEAIVPFVLSPFSDGRHQTVGIPEVETMSFSATFSQLERCWSHSPDGNPLTNVQCDIQGGALLMQFKKRPQCPTPPDPNAIYHFPYFTTSINEKAETIPVAPGASVTMMSQSQKYASIPRKVFLWVKKRNQDKSYTDTDSAFRIDKVNVNYDGVDGILCKATTFDLYNISRRNGYTGSYDDWCNRSGGYLCLTFGIDIPLQAGQAPGLRSGVNFTVDLTVTNIHPTDSIVPQISVLAIQEGVLSVQGTEKRAQIGLLTPETVNVQGLVRTPFYQAHEVLGGFSIADVPRFLAKRLKMALPVVRKGRDILESELVGRLLDRSNAPGAFKKARGLSRALTSVGLGKGGAILTEDELEERLRHA